MVQFAALIGTLRLVSSRVSRVRRRDCWYNGLDLAAGVVLPASLRSGNISRESSSWTQSPV